MAPDANETHNQHARVAAGSGKRRHVHPDVYPSLTHWLTMPWQQNYDPLHGPLSTIAAALPLVILLGLLALRRVTAYAAALAGLAAAIIVAVAVIGMPAPMAARAAVFGAAYGFLPIGWIVLNV